MPVDGFSILILHSHIDIHPGRAAILALDGYIEDIHPPGGIPIIHVALVSALGRAVHSVDEFFGKQRPGQRVIAGIDIAEIKVDEINRIR